MKAIKNGDLVKDTITGLTGIAIARTEWLNGCVRITIQPQELKDGHPVDPATIDVQQCEVVEEGTFFKGKDAPAAEGKPPGGPFPEPARAKDPTR